MNLELFHPQVELVFGVTKITDFFGLTFAGGFLEISSKPHLPVPYIFGTRGLVTWYITGSQRFQIYRELEDEGKIKIQEYKLFDFWIHCGVERSAIRKLGRSQNCQFSVREMPRDVIS